MELKNYQENVLKDLDSFIENVLLEGNAAKAYNITWKNKGVRVGGSNGIQSYNDSLNGVPSVCYKVPTGGGKTILGCASLKHIFEAMDRNKKKVVVWLVPWDTILDQTYSTLSDPNHFYRQRLDRDFSSKVQIFNKKQVITGNNFNPTSVNEQLSIIVMSYDSLRSNNKDNRKVYEENSNLMPFVNTYNHVEQLIKNVDESALMQVLNQMKPVVIIDESHNAQSDLSKEMIKNLNPSFVLELTATPKQDSNIISIVSANQLKEENMVKLPVIAYNRPSVERVIVEAIDLRNSLENAAKLEAVDESSYIRPIVLFQAQPKTDEDSVTFDKLKKSLIDIGIKEQEIAIKTATKNELNNVNLMSKDCEIRYIITVNALKEGWDCPNAYILASIANRTSKIDVEQILGRILRQPHQRKYANKLLNMSYVLTSSKEFDDTLNSILVGLNSAGFSRNDCRVIVSHTLDQISNNEEEIDLLSEEETASSSENVDNTIFNVQYVQNELKENGNNEENKNENIGKMIEQANKKFDEYEEEMEETSKEGTESVPQEFRNYSDIFKLKSEFKEEIENLELPVFVFKKEALLFENTSDELLVDIGYLNEGFTLDSAPIPQNITTSSDDIYKVDIESSEEGNVIKKSLLSRQDADDFKRYLELIPEQSRVKVCKDALINDLNYKFNNLSRSSIKTYVERIVSTLTTEDQIVSLQNNIYSISLRIKNFIIKLLEEYRYRNFKAKLSSNEISCKKRFKLNKSIIAPVHTNIYLRTLYVEEDARMNTLEVKFAEKISSLTNVKWWHRIIERSDFSLNGYLNHYPDFIVKTNSGKTILIETKGEHLDGDDSKKKLELGKLWANYAGPSDFKYFMAFEKNPLREDGSDLLDNIISMISRL